ncbi:tetratricopeptide repeat protein 28-like [Stylophora pistillata]|nr:tetratricopeptide repeat protein 28-like [Stylophora pistillata]
MVNYEYGSGEPCYLPHLPDKPVCELPVGCAQSNLVFLKVTDKKMYFWVVQIGNHVQFRKIKIGDYGSGPYLTENFIAKLNNEKFGTLRIKCENRSLDDEPCDDELAPESAVDKLSESSQTESVHKLYDIIIGPIADLINGHELIFVPERSLCMVPFAALMDSNSKYLCESFRIRVIPSLTTLKLIVDAKDDFHNKTGALLLGNPCLDEVLFEGRKLDPLPCAEREVKMIGDILDSTPLIGEEATKDEVLRRLSSVALVHIAAHGRMETGEIILAPRTNRKSQTPAEEDYLLTMKDVSDVHMRARLVVLSCCHSARGEIKAAEGVIGIARSFLGAGARSVLVALWALGDEATMEFMKYFYKELAAGKRASEALQQAMNCMREIEQFRNLRNWAPFVLIGDDVTLDLPDASEV